MNRKNDREEIESDNKKKFNLIMVAIILAITAGSISYRLLVEERLGQSSLLFIGIPALMAIIIALIVPGKTAMGIAFKGMALALLFSGIALGEGFICILMASPLFFLLAFIVVKASQSIRNYKNKNTRLQAHGLLVIIVMVISMEGVHENLSFDRDYTIENKITIYAQPSEIVKALSKTPQFNLEELPPFLKLGFPAPHKASGEGLEIGDQRVIHFAGGEGKPGDLYIRVKNTGDNFIEFEFLKDESHIAHWLEWKKSIVTWKRLSSVEMEITWTIEYERLLDPAWYFGPMQDYAMSLTAEYLLQSLILNQMG